MARRRRSKTPLTSSHASSITWLLRVSPMTKPSLQNLKLATSNGNYVNCNRSQNKWAIRLCAPPLNLQFLERGRAAEGGRGSLTRRPELGLGITRLRRSEFASDRDNASVIMFCHLLGFRYFPERKMYSRVKFFGTE